MNRELKKAIFIWLVDNKNEWQRINKCHEVFKQYIYTADRDYIIGGEEVSNFISKADELIYREE